MIAIVIDSCGVGELPDAGLYGDDGSNTLGNLAARVPLRIPTLRALGLGRLVALGGPPPAAPGASFGMMAERSPGKDSVTGHWELMGIVLDRPFPTFPDGFPAEGIREFERRIGRACLGNVVASGTQILDDLGAEHMRTGRPIVYTSADSVFQIAAHEDVIPVPELYRMCEVAYGIYVEGMGLGRVIARPFVGQPGHFVRDSAQRRDYAMPPVEPTLLDILSAAGVTVGAVGKIKDLFAGHGVSRWIHTGSDAEVMDGVETMMAEVDAGLIFANLVDFDALYGHRNDADGYAANLERFDARLGALLSGLRADDLLVLTADHGNDPTTPSTDHSREYVPVLVYGARVRPGVDLGVRETFADLGQTLAEVFGVAPLANGRSFWPSLRQES
ncbi:MAG: phosphopentomutase [Vicinamibacterales bacterium]|nr:phosphopentomutase [Vicinamibacterales bacterium]